MRWLGRTFLALLAVVALAVPALWIGRDVVPPRLARWAINFAAGAEVVDHLAFRIEGLSLGHLGLVDLTVNRDLTAERVRLDFDPIELLRGRLRTVTVSGAALALSVGPDGTIGYGSLGAAVAAFAGGTASPPGEPALRRLELRDTRLRLTGGIDGVLRLEGTVAPFPDGIVATLPWRLEAATTDAGPLDAGVAVAAEGRATLDSRNGGVRLGLSVADGRLARGALEVSGLGGTATLVVPASGPVEVAAELSAARAGAGEAELPAPYLHFRADRAGVSATARLGPASDPAVEIAAAADAASENGGRPFRVDGWADLEWLDALLAAWTERPAMTARGTAHAELTGRVPAGTATAAALWDGTVASGGVSILVAGTRLPSPASGSAFGSARLAVALAAGRLAVETVSPAVIDAMLERPLAGAAGALLGDGRLHVEFGTAAAPFRALLARPFGDASLDLAGPMRLTGGEAAAAADISATLARDGDGWRVRAVERAVVTAAGFAGGGADLHDLELRIEDLDIAPAGPRGTFAADIRLSLPGHGVTNAAVSATGRVESDAEGSRIVLTSPGRLSVARLAPSAGIAPLTGLAATVAAGERPVASRPAGDGPLTLRVPLDLPALQLGSAEPGAWGLALQPMRLIAEATVDTQGTGQVRARLTGATAEVTPAGVTLEGLSADLRAELLAGEPRLQRVDLRAQRVADKARLARFTPLSLEGVARAAATATAPDRVAFRMTMRGADGAFVLDAEGHHLPAAGRGEARIKLFPIQFVPGGLQPADLSPAAAAMFRDASGTVALGGRVRWPGEAVPPDDPLTLVLTDLGFTGSLGTVTGLGGAVALSRIDPPATPPGQALTAKAADIGVPLVAPRLRFRLEPQGVLRLEAVEASFAGGRVSATDVAVPLDGGRPVPVVLAVEAVDAARLAEAIDLDGLAATGTLSGWLPLLWDPAHGLSVRQARLTAGPGGGSLRYQPKAGAPALQDSGEQVSLLLKAIRNFVYESFEVEADGRPGEPFDVKLRLRGANPDLYDGYPIALNVTLTGALDQLFGNLRRSLGLTDVIQRRLQATTGGG